jgi:5-methyltetrahydrofolate--homocysteine methyltransferase
MAADYFDSGADMVETNSFGANRYVLGKYGLGDRVVEINSLAAEHARSAAPAGRYVLGSMGPAGELIEPMGTATPDDLLATFADQAKGLEAGGADAVCIETMIDFDETKIAVEATRANTKLAVMATMTFDKGPKGFFTMMGLTPEKVGERLTETGADVVGANCGAGIDQMIEVVSRIRSATDKPILVHSNAGMPIMQKGSVVYPETPEYMASRIHDLVAAGAGIVGGCCGSGPDHVRAFVKALRG